MSNCFVVEVISVISDEPTRVRDILASVRIAN